MSFLTPAHEDGMRVAALYDIHGNLPALEAVLAEVREAKVDRIVVGGDVVLGPMPLEALTALDHLDIPVEFIHGNCDREILSQMTTGACNIPEAYREDMRWVAAQLSPEHERLFASWPDTVRVAIPSLGDVLFCHATPRNDTEIFSKDTVEGKLLPIFEPLGVSLVICGHTHMQFDRMIGTTRVVNAGSVGMPFGKPGAYWLLLGPDVQLRHTRYDLEGAAARIRNTSYPRAEEFAATNVLQPPSEETILKAYSVAELK